MQSLIWLLILNGFITQGAIVGEKRSGTAAWILSNPVSRSAFILSKLIGNAMGILAILVVLQGLVAYSQISLRGEDPFTPIPFAAAMGLQSLHLLFYLTLALMLGTFFNATGPVIGISIGFLIAHNVLGQLLAGFAMAAIGSARKRDENGRNGGTRADFTFGVAYPDHRHLTDGGGLHPGGEAIWRFQRGEF